MWRRVLAAAGWWLATGGLALAQSLLPFEPSPRGRHALQLLVDEAGLAVTTSQWPLPARAVADALAALPAELPPALGVARDRVAAELRQADGAALRLQLAGRQDAPSAFGDDGWSGLGFGLRSPVVGGDDVQARVGARWQRPTGELHASPRIRPEGSALAFDAGGLLVQGWSHRAWWGPGWQSSLVLGHNAPALTGVGVQRAAGGPSASAWWSWLGPWSFEMFLAQAEDVDRPPNPYIFGQRLTLRPLPGLEIGLTRTAQWGGGGRRETFRSFVDMLIGRGTNAETPEQQARDPANELAGVDLRLRCPAGVRCAGYAQLIGEDAAGLLPIKFLTLYGLETWTADGRWRHFVEYADTQCVRLLGARLAPGCAYRNVNYPEGYASGGRWLGASFGPDSRTVTIGTLDGDTGLSLRLAVGRIGARMARFEPVVTDGPDSGRMLSLSVRRPFELAGATVTPALDWVHLRAPTGPRNDVRGALQVVWPL